MRSLLGFIFLGCSLACPEDPNCRMCVQTTCVICFDSIVNSEGKCDSKISAVPHCSLYHGESGKSSCRKCVPGYFLEFDGQCLPCEESECAKCKPPGDFCEMCFDGFLAAQNGKCTKKKTVDPGCFVARDNGVCEICREGFSLRPDMKCQKGLSNCQFQSSDSRCDICLEGTFLTSEGACQGTPKPIPDRSSASTLLRWIFIIASLLVVAAIIFVLVRRRKNHVEDSGKTEPILQNGQDHSEYKIEDVGPASPRSNEVEKRNSEKDIQVSP